MCLPAILNMNGMKKIKKNQVKEAVRIVEYMISGGAYFWVGYLTFFALDKGLHWNLWWATMTANVAGWTVNYLMQRYWVFKSSELKGHKTEVTGRYITITLVDFVMNYFILLGLKQMGITPYIGQFISAAFFTVWNYLWYRFWVFPTKFKKKPGRVKAHRAIVHRPHGHSAFHGVK